MEKLIPLLQDRYDKTVSKVGKEFIYGICNYFDLFATPEIQSILEQQKQLPNGHHQKFLLPYEVLQNKVYQPMKTRPDLAEWKFRAFFDLYEDVDNYF